MEIVSARCSGNIQDMDRSQKYEIFLGTSQAKWMTGKMVSKVARL